MSARIFQKIWLGIVGLLTAVIGFIACIFARDAIWGYSGASGDPTGTGMARLGAGVLSAILGSIASLFAYFFVRGVKRLTHDS